MLSMISNGETNVIAELSDSISSNHSIPASKRLREASVVSKFKGVVPQLNGHWDAQIYANHQRVRLGTFKSEKEAAMAYDRADSHRNYPWTKITIEELDFQNHYSTEAVLNMIRDGSYPSRFAEFLRNHSKSEEKDKFTQMKTFADGWLMCRQLFQKELTPSDVGKLNRLVIPKKFAVKYFPQISENGEECAENDNGDDVEVVEISLLLFTRGWNRFVKEIQLKTNDTIAFYLCELRENAKVSKSFSMNEINKGENSGALAEVSSQCVDMKIDLQLLLGRNVVHDENENKVEEDENENKIEVAEEVELMGPSLTSDSETKPFELWCRKLLGQMWFV